MLSSQPKTEAASIDEKIVTENGQVKEEDDSKEAGELVSYTFLNSLLCYKKQQCNTIVIAR